MGDVGAFAARAGARAGLVCLDDLSGVGVGALTKPGGGLRRAVSRMMARSEGAGHARFAGADDKTLLERSLRRLESTGAIEYVGEFGAELTTFVPFVHWLKLEGRLESRRVVTYRGMRPYYFFLSAEQLIEKPGRREWLHVKERDWPTNSTWHAVKKLWHAPPDYRARYRGQGRTFRRPLLFVQNKFTIEASRGPINYLPLLALERLLEATAGRFDVVYSRPRAMPRGVGYTDDQNDYCDYPDLELVRRFAHVLDLEDHCARGGLDYNLTKLEILAKARLFVGVQGGGAHLLAYFGDSLLLLLHYHGHEYPHAYALGPYKYLSTPPPLLLLARRHWQLERGLELIASAQVADDRVWIDRGLSTLVERLAV